MNYPYSKRSVELQLGFLNSSIWSRFRIPKILIIPLLALFLLPISSKSQEAHINVKGRVIDSEKGTPLAGVKLEDEKRKVLGVTDVGGYFFIQIQASSNVTLKLLGYTTLSKKITELSKDLTIKMEKSDTQLEEVVVTALNISREKKSLGYSVTTVTNEQLTNAISNNWTDALSGKVPGLNLIRSNAGPTGSSSIILRGENNLTGSNDALIIVDGVIINGGSGRMVGNSGAYLDEAVIDYGTSLNDINPDDIEDVSVLKGPGAAALYGSRGANGAIMITTKSGKKREKGLGVTVNSNTSIGMINRMPDLQYEYGQGNDGINYYSHGASEDGEATNRTSKAFGPKFDGQYFFQYDPVTGKTGTERTLWRPYEGEGYDKFFETSQTYTNSISIDGGSDKTTARFSYTNANNKWIVPNTGYDRNTVAISATSNPAKKLKISSKANYTSKKSDNLPTGGYNNQTIMYGYIFWQPNAPISWMENYWEGGKKNSQQSTPLMTGPDNPYFIAYEMLNTQNRNSLTGSVDATYTVIKDLNVTIRSAIDWANDSRSQQRPFDTNRFPKGMYRNQDVVSREINNDVLIKYKKEINKDLDVDISAGGSMLKNFYSSNEVRADSLLFPGEYTFANSAGALRNRPYKSEYAINSVYGLGTVGYRNFAFVDLTVRKDWSSTLASPYTQKGVKIPAYFSINSSLVLSEIFDLPKNINYFKWRGSFAGVGSGGNTPYMTSIEYSADPDYNGGLYNPTTLNNPFIKPLFTGSYETGLEAKFFKSRIGLDLTFYLSDTKDQILTSLLDASTGYRRVVANAGRVRNKGIELALEGSPIKQKKGLQWDVSVTFSANKNIVMELDDDLDNFTLQNGPGSNGFIIAYVGGSMGDLYGRGYLRSPDGQIVYQDGMPMLSEDIKYLGNTMPQWKGGINNKFRYNGFSMGFLFDAQYGSKAYSLTQGKMAVQGKTRSTLPGRYNGIIGDGVMLNSDGSYSPNTVIAEDLSTYYDNHFGVSNVEGSVFSTDFIKLREARIDYSFNRATLKKLKLQRATIGLYGRDLLIISKWPGFDPEFGTLSGSDINRGFEIGQFPSTRSFGINLTVGI